jgi:hypothetical protein
MAGGVDVGSPAHFSFKESREHVYAMRNRRCSGERKRGSQRRLIDILTPFDE